MLSEDLKDKLRATLPNQNECIGWLIYWLYRYFTYWQQEKSNNKDSDQIKLGYISLLSNIGVEGSTNKDLAQKAMVSKQAMSKLINEMLLEDLIEMEKDKMDSRSKKIMLTNKGAEALIQIMQNNQYLFKEFEGVLGENKVNLLIELISELMVELSPNKKK